MTSKTVAIFDILGVKDELEQGRAEGLYSEYSHLVQMARNHLRNFAPQSQRRSIFLRPVADETYRCSLHIFSDTIILISEDDSFDGFLEVALTSWRIMQSSLILGRPVRGAIAFGDMHVDRASGVFVGKALVDAHQLEAAQRWAGASLHPSVLSRFPPSYWREHGAEPVLQALFPEYEVPLKGNKTEHLRALNWRLQYVIKEGLLAVFLRKSGVAALDALHPYTQEMFRFSSAMRATAYLGGEYPVELSVYWAGNTEPPWPNGDEF